MSNIRINAANPAKRCEICHQADCYDEQTGYCSRCANSNLEIPANIINGEPTITIKAVIESSDQLLSVFWFNNKSRVGLALAHLSLIILFYCLSLPALMKNFFIFCCGLCFLTQAIMILLVIKNCLSKNRSKSAVTFTFAKSYIGVSSDKGSAKLSWDAVERVDEIKKYFYIFIKNKNYLILPKRFIQSNQELNDIRTILKAKFPLVLKD